MCNISIITLDTVWSDIRIGQCNGRCLTFSKMDFIRTRLTSGTRERGSHANELKHQTLGGLSRAMERSQSELCCCQELPYDSSPGLIAKLYCGFRYCCAEPQSAEPPVTRVLHLRHQAIVLSLEGRGFLTSSVENEHSLR